MLVPKNVPVNSRWVFQNLTRQMFKIGEKHTIIWQTKRSSIMLTQKAIMWRQTPRQHEHINNSNWPDKSVNIFATFLPRNVFFGTFLDFRHSFTLLALRNLTTKQRGNQQISHSSTQTVDPAMKRYFYLHAARVYRLNSAAWKFADSRTEIFWMATGVRHPRHRGTRIEDGDGCLGDALQAHYFDFQAVNFKIIT